MSGGQLNRVSRPGWCRSAVVLTAASQAYSSFDIPYPYRPNTDFLYLTGFRQPTAVLVIDNFSRDKEARLTMFVERRDAVKETWEGARAGPSVAERVFGADVAYETEHLEQKLQETLRTAEHVSAVRGMAMTNPGARSLCGCGLADPFPAERGPPHRPESPRRVPHTVLVPARMHALARRCKDSSGFVWSVANAMQPPHTI